MFGKRSPSVPPLSMSHPLNRKLEAMGYTRPTVKKSNGQWNAIAFDPLNSIEVNFVDLGSSLRSAISALDKLPRVPNHYICGYPEQCAKCGVTDRPIGYRDSNNGDFIQRCKACKHEWIALTAAEQLAQAEARMNEASEVLNPVLKAFLKR